MNAKNKNTKIRRVYIILITVGALLFISASGYILQDKIKVATSDSTASAENNNKPKFVVDNAKLPDWWTYGNRQFSHEEITEDTIQQDEWPIAAISIHQCRPTSRCEDPKEDVAGGRCFVMAFYKKGVLDPKTAIADRWESFGNSGAHRREIDVKMLSMHTPEGIKDYHLYQYDIGHSGGAAYKRGNALGLIPLAEGHIEVQSICDEASQLDETLAVLDSIRLTP